MAGFTVWWFVHNFFYLLSRYFSQLPGRHQRQQAQTRQHQERFVESGQTRRTAAALVSESPCTPMRHSSTMPHRLTPAAPPSVRMKLMALDPCGISAWLSPRIAPRLSDGQNETQANTSKYRKRHHDCQRRAQVNQHHQRKRSRQQSQATLTSKWVA